MPRKQVGRFTVEYVRRAQFGDGPKYKYEHGVTATSRSNLLVKADARCPEGMYVKSINWQHVGGTSRIWYTIVSKKPGECWDDRVAERAFGPKPRRVPAS